MATCSSILAWKIPRTEEPGGLQSMGSQKVRRESIAAAQHKELQLNSKKKKNLFQNWAEELNRCFFQRKHTEGQQTHEKMLNITHHQGNANPNHNEVSPHTCQDDYHQKYKRKYWWGCGEKGKSLLVGMQICAVAVENSMKFPQKIKSRMTVWSSIFTPWNISKGSEITMSKDDAVKVLHSICQQIWKIHQWPQD